MTRTLLALSTGAAALAGCSMAPKYIRPETPVPPSWPVGDAYLRQSEQTLPAITFRDVFRDPRLQTIVEQALANNRDLRIAAANIESARAQYRIQRADLFPVINASGSYTYRDGGSGTTNLGNTGTGNGGTGSGTGTGTGTGGTDTGAGTGAGTGTTTTAFTTGANSSWSASIGTTAFELDLFGRILSLSNAALSRYFEQEAAARATRLTLVGDIATAWLNYGADQSLLKVAQDTATSAEATVRITRARLEGGIAPRTDLAQAQQILATANSDLAQQRTLVAQDVNALQLLVGAPVDAALLPKTIAEAEPTIATLPAGLDSGILLRRPDVVQAEYELRATNAEIGAARAALFPRISLTGLLGFASSGLSNLFTGGAFNYSVSPSISYPIFQAGAARANVRYTEAQKQAALATYERAIQSAFRETADALARQGTIGDQRRANEQFLGAAATTLRLTDASYRGGVTPFLNTLDAQRSYYSAQQTVIASQLLDATNRVTLYRVLGGDSTLETTKRGPEPVTATGAPRTQEPLMGPTPAPSPTPAP